MVIARTYKIKYKIFKREDIVNLWRYCDSLRKSQKGSATIEIHNIGTQLASSEEDIFSTINFNSRPIIECIVRYRSEDYRSSIYITLRERKELSVSSVDIEGTDMDWVNAVDMRLKEILDEVTTRSFLYRMVFGEECSRFWGFLSFVAFFLLYIVLPRFLPMSDMRAFVMALLASGLVGVIIPLLISFSVSSVIIDVTGERILRLKKKLSIFWRTLGSIAISMFAAYLFRRIFG